MPVTINFANEKLGMALSASIFFGSAKVGLIISLIDDLRSIKSHIFKLSLDNSLNIWFFDDHGY